MNGFSRLFRASMLIAAAGLGGVSCTALGQLNLLSTQQEVEIGEQAAREIERSLPIYRDPIVQGYVDSLGQALARHSRRTDITYHIKVVDTDEVNAFAVPGGWLYVNLGLITTAENESELAGVMGHEIGHVVGRHGARQITKRFGLGVLIELAVGGSGDRTVARDVAGQFAQLGAGLTLLKYGRDAELEADRFAVEETYSAGVDPEGMATFFEKLLAEQESEQEDAGVWFSTHPATQERIAKVRAGIAKLPAKPGLKMDSDRFQFIKARIAKREAGRKRRTPRRGN